MTSFRRIRQLFDTANYSYILPSHRLTVYILGVGVGYLLRKLPKNYKINDVSIPLTFSGIIFHGRNENQRWCQTAYRRSFASDGSYPYWCSLVPSLDQPVWATSITCTIQFTQPRTTRSLRLDGVPCSFGSRFWRILETPMVRFLRSIWTHCAWQTR